MRSVTGTRTSKEHDFREFWTKTVGTTTTSSPSTSCRGLSTYTCIKALKCRRQALFLIQIQNLKSDFRDFERCIMFIVRQKAYVLEVSEYQLISCGQNMVHLKIYRLYSGLGLKWLHPSWSESWWNSQLMKWVDSWWNRKNLGETSWILVNVYFTKMKSMLET